MFKIVFYKNQRGDQPVKDFIIDLSKRQGKHERIQLNKINDYLSLLQSEGITLKEPHVKHIEDDIFELRPLDNRIFFFYYLEDQIVLLHHFKKRTKKTPRREIEKAKNNMKDFIKRSE